MKAEVNLTKKAIKGLEKAPFYIVDKFQLWVDLVIDEGLRAARLIKGYHDEPLKGQRSGQRSIRLNQAYRAIYVEKHNGEIEIVEVLEVNKHEY